MESKSERRVTNTKYEKPAGAAASEVGRGGKGKGQGAKEIEGMEGI